MTQDPNETQERGDIPRPVSRLRRPTLPGLLLGVTLSFPVFSGGGPETTLVVVNAASPLSLEIANEYVNLRQIPPTHVIFLQDVPYQGHLDLKQFRQRIWQPIQDYLTRYGLMDQIDTISYSSGFPYDVDFKRQSTKLKLPKNRLLGRRASLTGLTYYARQIAAGEPGYLSKNRYFRRNLSPGRCRGPIYRLRKDDKQRLKDANHNLKSKKFQEAIAAYQVLLKNNPQNNRIPFDLARSFAALGMKEKALDALQKAVDACWTNSLATLSDGYLKSLHDHPIFQMLLQRMRAAYGPFELSHGFSSRYHWSRTLGGNPSDRYFLSTLLAYTGPQGNSVGEVLGYLRAAAASDGSQPDGTVYLMENNNVRSVTRQPLFPATVKELETRNHRVEILSRKQKGQSGILPRNRDDVIGLVAGSSNFDWGASGSRLLPGAIAETLTSYGAHFHRKKQTKLSEFLRYGAAGSSGAVAEPYALQDKFPVPMIHVYYADGVSLAEAFYQSLRFPYQTLIVGDPLARPFARFAEISLEHPDPAKPWQGQIQLLPRVLPATERPIIRVELWIDGQQVTSTTLDKHFLALLNNNRRRFRQVDVGGEFKIETPGFYELAFGSRGRVVVAVDEIPLIDEQLTDEHPEVFAGVSLETGWHQIEISIEPDKKLHFRTLIAGATPAFKLTGKRVRHRP